MRIGFACLYAWRPHVEHMQFLAGLALKAGHEVRYLTCDSDLPTCYTRELRPSSPAWLQCALCRAGGIRSYAASGVTSIGSLHPQADRTSLGYEWSKSSAATLGRYESNEEFAGPELRERAARLAPASALAYAAARKWIERERLEALCLFNGRIDVMRAILEAARHEGIRYVSVERTWFSSGLQLLPDENCLGLRNINRMMSQWRGAPLTYPQAARAAQHIASRFLRENSTEWRAYNVRARRGDWPVKRARRRVLLVPGSRNEVWGHPDRTSAWPEPTLGYDALMQHLRLEAKDVVLRCHPNWAEAIGKVTGALSEQYYMDWARRRGVVAVPSADNTSTLGLIEQADAIVVAGGSAALEAGALGKQVIALAPSIYQEAGFESRAYQPEDLAALRLDVDLPGEERAEAAARVARQTLRFCYCMVYRIPQYVDEVRCITTTQFTYAPAADPERFIRLLRTGVLEADDAEKASDAKGEDAVLQMIHERAWDRLRGSAPSAEQSGFVRSRRRWLYRPVDRLRAALPRGDR